MSFLVFLRLVFLVVLKIIFATEIKVTITSPSPSPQAAVLGCETLVFSIAEGRFCLKLFLELYFFKCKLLLK